jgi:HEAT repeat protein
MRSPTSSLASDGRRPRRLPARAAASFALATALFALAGSRAPLATAAPDPVADAQKDLASTDPVEVLRGIGRLAGLDSPEARKALVRYGLRGPCLRLRLAAIDAAAGRADRETVIDSVVFRLQNAGNDVPTALHAAEALGRLPSVRTEKALLARLRYGMEEVADAIAISLYATGTGPGTVTACKDALQGDSSPRRRAAAADALGRIGGDTALEILATAASREPSRLVRERIVTAMLAGGVDRAREGIFERSKRATPEERVALLFAAARVPSPGLLDSARKAEASFHPLQISAGCLAIGGEEGDLATEDEDRLLRRLAHKDAVVRDAALHALMRRLASSPDRRLSLLARQPHVSADLRVALLASLQDVTTPQAREALAEAARSKDWNEAVTAIGALRRGHGVPGKEVLATMKTGTPYAHQILTGVVESVEGGLRPRAWVVMDDGDRAEEVLASLGWTVMRMTSGSELMQLQANPEDLVVVDGPSSLGKEAEANLRRFLMLGGTLVLLDGFDNRLWKSLVPDAVDRAPGNLRLEVGANSPALTHRQNMALPGVQDFDVYAAAGSNEALVKALRPVATTPPPCSVMLIPYPVPLRTAAARPVLWSSEMAERYGGDGCVAAEVRIGCGRILLMGGLLGLRGALQAEGWFVRTRVDRRSPYSRPNDAVERKWVAYDSFGVSESRLGALDAAHYFAGDQPWAMGDDHPATRWLKAWFETR